MEEYTFHTYKPENIDELYNLKDKVCKEWLRPIGILKGGEEDFKAFFSQVGFANENVIILKYNGEIVGFSGITIIDSIGLFLKSIKVSAQLLPLIIIDEHRQMLDSLFEQVKQLVERKSIDEIEGFDGELWGGTQGILMNNDFKEKFAISTFLDFKQYTGMIGDIDFTQVKKDEINELTRFQHTTLPTGFKEAMTIQELNEIASENFENGAEIYWITDGREIQASVEIMENNDVTYCMPFVTNSDDREKYSILALRFTIGLLRERKKDMMSYQSYTPSPSAIEVLSNDGLVVKKLTCYSKELK